MTRCGAVTLRDLRLETSGHHDCDTDTKGLRPVAKDAIGETDTEAFSDVEFTMGGATISFGRLSGATFASVGVGVRSLEDEFSEEVYEDV